MAVDRDSVCYTSLGESPLSIEKHATVKVPVDARDVSAITVSDTG
jgi:hypothetical protein